MPLHGPRPGSASPDGAWPHSLHHRVPTDSGETYAWPAAAAAPAPQQAAAPAAGTDRVTRLAEFNAQEVVSEEEFAAEKARILNS
ncbi:hypothetical protein [Streptomyces sp. NBC_01185]|uniref:hypothetical protein n=1 Tax=Streptomyces sp. NBC_01185 TaxID=2903764 RepID=UPI00386E7498|nr:hypothetical protein OG770_36705 [Streptomyces sp. NBC_01185]